MKQEKKKAKAWLVFFILAGALVGLLYSLQLIDHVPKKEIDLKQLPNKSITSRPMAKPSTESRPLRESNKFNLNGISSTAIGAVVGWIIKALLDAIWSGIRKIIIKAPN